jgi:sugar O-acyltransferase (sialic acid O-acetyltransferase NeuD family)
VHNEFIMNKSKLVIFAASNILSDIFECALANGLTPTRVILDLPEPHGARDRSLLERLKTWSYACLPPVVEPLESFIPTLGEVYILGPTTPQREYLANKLLAKFGLPFCTLVHPTAYVSPSALLGAGVFVGAGSIIGPGAIIGDNVFINRGVTIGHDTTIEAYSRIQPGCNIGGLTKIGRSVSISIGATIVDRIVIGSGSIIAAGAVVLHDLDQNVMAAGAPATIKKRI